MYGYFQLMLLLWRHIVKMRFANLEGLSKEISSNK